MKTEPQLSELAQVIVDVPTMQTDQPYTYSIPNWLQNQVSAGMRVVVPFGRRKVQGFVVGFATHSNYRLKPINSLMDLTPVVNTELLELSRWLARTTFSFRIECLLTMLPSVMKAKYQKKLVLTKPVANSRVKQLFGPGRTRLLNRKLDPRQTRLLLKLRRRGQVRVEYVVKNQARTVKVIKIQNLLTTKQLSALLNQLKPSQTGRRSLLTFLINHPNRSYQESIVTKRYHFSTSVVRTAAKHGWLKRFRAVKYRDPYQRPVKRNYPFKLNRDQARAVKQIDASIRQHRSDVYLLEGVTGSGKTEVYLQTISKALAKNETALMLVPEISLTPQMVNWVKGRFGNLVAILHSGLSAGEKYDEWRRIRSGQARVVIGARSAIFAPLKHLGVIIMDEEHDSSYKQEDTPRYQTRSVAKWRGRYHHCPVVLGSATPSLESRARATKHRYRLLRLKHRINRQALPKVHIVDMRKEIMLHRESNYSMPLLKAIKSRLKHHEQVILMLNRRGYSSFLMCRECGYVPKCPNCDISLTFHLRSHALKCHYCGYEEPVPTFCPKCHSSKINYLGTGTEQAQRELQKLVPQARIVRMDVDTTSRKGAHARLLHEFGSGQANVLLGTQMIAKGLDFPNVTLVGVLSADTSLELPDFRAAERTFQLLTQVSGRAGRADKLGEVFIQTFNPDNYAIKLAQQQDYELFYRIEMRKRHRFNYPPYFFTVKITAASADRQRALTSLYQIKLYLIRHLAKSTLILGPAPGVITRLKRKYFFQIVIRYKYEPHLQGTLTRVLDVYQSQTRKGLFISIDPEPNS